MKRILLTIAAVILFAAPALPDRNRVVNQDLTGMGGRNAIDTLARPIARQSPKPEYRLYHWGFYVFMVKK